MGETGQILKPLLEELSWCGRPRRYVVARNVHLGRGSGLLDGMLVTDDGRIFLIETKFRKNKETRFGVVGQIVAYYAHALSLGSDHIWAAFERAPRSQRKANRRSLCWRPDQRGQPEAAAVQGWIKRAYARKAPRVTAVIAVDKFVDDDDYDHNRLGLSVRFLAEQGLSIGIISKKGRKAAKWIVEPGPQRVPGKLDDRLRREVIEDSK